MAKQSKQTKGLSIIPKPVIGSGKVTSPVLVTEEDKRRSLEKMNQRLRFSLHYLDHGHEAFNCGGTETSWFISLFDTLKEVSKLSLNELISQRQHYDAHQHEWEKLDYRYSLPEHLWEQVEDSCWQFRLSKSKGRIHGFVISNTFYIVWLDPHHNLYPDERFGGRKSCIAQVSQWEEMVAQKETAERELLAAKEEVAGFIEYCEQEIEKERLGFKDKCENCEYRPKQC